MNSKPNFGKAAAWMIVTTIILSFGFVRLYKNQKPYLDEAVQLQETGHSMNLDKDCKVEGLADLLMGENIVTDQEDARQSSCKRSKEFIQEPQHNQQ